MYNGVYTVNERRKMTLMTELTPFGVKMDVLVKSPWEYSKCMHPWILLMGGDQLSQSMGFEKVSK